MLIAEALRLNIGTIIVMQAQHHNYLLQAQVFIGDVWRREQYDSRSMYGMKMEAMGVATTLLTSFQ